MAISEMDKHKLKKLVKELEKYRGRHTELVTVYVPAGYDINGVISQISDEQGTASNIKSKQTRDNVITALEKLIQHLRLYKQTPKNGLAVFSGNVSEKEGQQNFKVWGVEPPVPLNLRTYRCDKEFILDPIREMLDTDEIYGLVVMDRRDANLALLKGKTIIPLQSTHSEVPGKMRAGGQCLTKGTTVQTHDGSLINIEDIHNPHKVISKDLKPSKVTDKWQTKKKQVYQITTKSPRIELNCSEDHRIFCSTPEGMKEKKAKELKKDDLVITPEKIDIKGKEQKIQAEYNSYIITKEGRYILKKSRQDRGMLQKDLAKKTGLTQTAISFYEIGKINIGNEQLKKICQELEIKNFNRHVKKNTSLKIPKTVTKELAQFIGYLEGDGTLEDERITFFEQRKHVAKKYEQLSKKLFNANTSYKFRESKNYHQVRIYGKPLINMINKEFPEIQYATDSTIPSKILKSKDEVLAGFLKGLFDAEGYCTTSRNCVALGANNKKLIEQLQSALLRFGIISSIHTYDNRRNPYSNRTRYTIDITEKQSIELFKKEIGFTAKDKSCKLKEILINKSNTSTVRQIIVPGTKIREMVYDAGYKLSLFPKVNNFFRNERMISKEAFKNSIMSRVKDKKLLTKLKKIYEINLLPVRVSSVKKTRKYEEMIDISVKDQCFFANNLLVHNSAPRFQRIRENAKKDHYKKIAEYMKKQFLMMENLKGIIVGGPGTTVNDFLNHDFITGDVKAKIIGTKDLAYTGDFGLQELLDRSEDLLAAEEVANEKKIMARFFNLLSKKPEIVTYGKDHVMNAVKMSAVDILLLSEALDDTIIEEFEEAAEVAGTTVTIVSTETREGVQLRDMGKVAAILRYPIHND